MADYDKYAGAPVVWLLDLSYKHNDPRVALDRHPPLLCHGLRLSAQNTYILSHVREFHVRGIAGELSEICGTGDFRKYLVCMRNSTKINEHTEEGISVVNTYNFTCVLPDMQRAL
jgi:hypothetical protein